MNVISIFDQYPDVEIHADPKDGGYQITYTEVEQDKNNFKFNRVKKKIKKEEIEKFIGAIITICKIN